VLTPGTQFWLSIVNDTTGDADDNWFWIGDTDAGSIFAQRISETANWAAGSANRRLDFQLTNDALAVPEPHDLLLLVFGLAALGALRRAQTSRSL
jgi:hypothetical protein